MTDEEGVIKYLLNFVQAKPPAPEDILEINNWRTLLYQMQLIGQDDSRYGGLGYGNISCRVFGTDHFIVTGTQTGSKPRLVASDYCVVSECDVEANRLTANGQLKPSSEAITHGAIYQFDANTNVVMHVHCPEIWRCADALRLPKTGEATAYGTPELAREIKALFSANCFTHETLFVIPGHKDGVVAFGENAEQAGHQIIATLACAIQNFK